MSKDTTYKLRAESDLDVLELVRLSPRVNSLTFEYPDSALRACVVTFKSELCLAELLLLINQIPDGHVMTDTVARKAKYTGERRE